MRFKDNIQLKRDDIEINFSNMLKYVLVRSIWILVISLIFSVIIPTVKYFKDEDDISNSLESTEEGISKSEQLQAYIDRLAFYEETYESESEHRANSILMKLDSKNIHTATVQYYVESDEKYTADVMTAFYNYGTDGSLISDIYKLDDSLAVTYLQEVISFTCSSYDSYEVSSVVNVKIYAEDEVKCAQYASLITQVLNSFSERLNGFGIINTLEKIDEKHYIGQDNDILLKQKEYNSNYAEIEGYIATLREKIAALEAEGVYIESVEISAKFSLKYMIIGFAVGCILSVAIIVIKYIFMGRFKYENELNEITDINYIETIYTERKNVIEKIFFKDKFATVRETRLLYKVKALCDHHQTKEIVLVGDVDNFDDVRFKQIEDKLKDEDISLKYVGDVVNDSEAMAGFEMSQNAIFIVTALKTSYDYMDELVKLCAIKETNVLGYIFIE